MPDVEATKTHVAFTSSPGLGHIIPLLEFAKRLVTHHDFHVSFLLITTNEPSAAVDQLFHSLPRDLQLVKLPPVDVFSITTVDMTVVHRLAVIVEESLKSLKSVLLDIGKPKALVIDLFTSQAFDVCKELSVPVYTFFTASVALLAFSLYLPTLDRDVEGEFVDLPGPIQVPGCTPVRPEDLLDQVKNRKIDEYKWYLYHLDRIKLAAGIFLNSWEDLEPVAIRAIREDPFYKSIPTPPVYPIGPVIKEEETLSSSDKECLAFLDKQPPDSVLFVSLGSGGTLTFEQLTELAWGLELSEQRFIFVVRVPTDTSASAAFFNVGSDSNDPKAYLPEGFIDRTQGRGLVVPSWAPQVSVLKHPSTGAILSHCGWNSTLEALSCGVPIIGWPLYAEQRMNGTILEEQICVAMKAAAWAGPTGKRLVGRDEVKKMVKLVMEGDEGKTMRRKAKELKDSAAKVLGVGGSSYESLAGVIKEWKAM